MSIFKKDYDENYFNNYFYKGKAKSQRTRNRLDEVLKYKKSGRLLEVGCGEGFFLLEASKSFNVEGIDISSYVIQNNNTHLKDKVVVGNIQEIKLKPHYYDVVVAFNVFEHLRHPEATIRKLHKSLKAGGILIGSTSNNYGLVGGLATMINNLADKTHCSTYSPVIWAKYFTNANFSIVRFFGEVVMGRNRSIYVKNSLWKFLSPNFVFVCRA